MTTKCIELEYPFDGRRKATIVTNNKQVCKYLAENPDGQIGITIGEKDEIKYDIKGYYDIVNGRKNRTKNKTKANNSNSKS